MEIPDPPTATACGACMRPLTWLYSNRRKTWMAFVRDGNTITVHTCRDPRPDQATSWQTQPRPNPDRVRAGVALARAALTNRATAAGNGR